MNSVEWKPEILTLGPGGTKSYMELGTLLKFESEEYLKNIKHYVGCSSGSVIGLLLTSGYNISEIIQYSFDENILTDITDVDLLKDLIENKGIFGNGQIETSLRQKIIDKFAFDVTFYQLYMATGIKFTVVVYNVEKERPEYLSIDTEPNLSCVTAVMMSVCVPILTKRRMYKGCEYVDGALGNPYPIDIHDNGMTKILGIFIKHDNKKDKNPISLLCKLASASINQLYTRIIEYSSDCCKHILLNMSDIYIKSKNKLRTEMIKYGYKQASNFINVLKNPKQRTTPESLLDKHENISLLPLSPLLSLPHSPLSTKPLIDFDSFNSPQNQIDPKKMQTPKKSQKKSQKKSPKKSL